MTSAVTGVVKRTGIPEGCDEEEPVGVLLLQSEVRQGVLPSGWFGWSVK